MMAAFVCCHFLASAQIVTNEVSVQNTNNLTTVNGDMQINGNLDLDQIDLSATSFGQLMIDIQANNVTNAMRVQRGSETVGNIKFYPSTWYSGNTSKGAGTLNLDGLRSVTIGGNTNNFTAIFRESDGFVGIGVANPTSKLHVDGAITATSLNIPKIDLNATGFGQLMIDIQASNVTNALRVQDGTGMIGNIKAYPTSWHSGSTGKGAGSLNLEGQRSVTIGGDFNNFIAIFRKSDGHVGIGVANPTEKLHVNGNIRAAAGIWADFVFETDYQLPKLEEVESHIVANGHLKDIPSEAEVLENGINLGEMDAKLLQKIEELTLYLIEQNKEIKALKMLTIQQQSEIEKLKSK